jgi:hypothetical protein
MKKYASLLLSGIALLAISAIWVVPKINTAKHDTYVRVVEKPQARSHWEAVKKNVDAVQLERKTQKELVNPDRFETKKVSVKDFVFDEDMYGRGMHYEPYEEIPVAITDSVAVDSLSAAIPIKLENKTNE